MSDCGDQLRAVCRWNRELSCENARLREMVRRLIHENRELADANARLVAQAEASESLLGAAMDEALERSPR